jgi:tRNA G46 methylase TrmB
MTPTRPEHLPDVNRFFAVDDVEQPDQFVRFLEEAKALPAIVAAKTQMRALLQPEHVATALDVGCGYGADVIELAKRLKPDGRATGIDIARDIAKRCPAKFGGVEVRPIKPTSVSASLRNPGTDGSDGGWLLVSPQQSFQPGLSAPPGWLL